MAPTVPRIERLFAKSLESVTAADVRQLIADAVVEDTDLDFKSTLYGNADSDKRDLSGDVAAMANTTGGVILLGVQEGNGQAAGESLVALSDQEERRIHAIVASGIAPPPSLRIIAVPDSVDQASGFYLVVVPRSPYAPHAVRLQSGLRYPRRAGAGTVYMSESEIADLYRQRFAGASAAREAIAEIEREGAEALAPEALWITMALSPLLPGAARVDSAGIVRMRSWVNQRVGVLQGCEPFSGGVQSVGAGVQRYTAASGIYEGYPRFGYSELHASGAGFAAREVQVHNEGGETNPIHFLFDESFVMVAHALLMLLVRFATDEAKASGDALVRLSLTSTVPGGIHNLVLAHTRNGGPSGSPWSGTRPWKDRTLPTHAIDLDEVLSSPQASLRVARMILSDAWQNFGLPEVAQIAEDGSLRGRYFNRHNRHDVDVWALRNDVPVTEGTLAF